MCINHRLSLKIDLLKQVSRGELPLNMCVAVAKTRTILQELYAKIRKFSQSILKQSDIIQIHLQVFKIPDIYDEIYLCTATLGNFFTNDHGGTTRLGCAA